MRIREERFSIKGAPLDGVNPLPNFRRRKPTVIKCNDTFPNRLKVGGAYITKVLPYLMQDRYSHTHVDMALKCFVLENEYLEARFLPEYGGRLHSLYDKVLKKQLLFTNTVIQPGNLATRNAWLSGGIEWNVGNYGHTYTTCDNVFAAILSDGQGNEFLRIYEFERNKSIFWQSDFHLPDSSRHLIAHVRMVNPFDKDTTTYWWSNIAVPTDTETRVLASNKNVISFVQGECRYETLPYINSLPGIDVSYPTRAPRAFDFFIQKDSDNESTWEAAAYRDGTAFYERSTAPLYYKKLFTWGNHRAGEHWQEFLSAGKGTGYYAELQAGIAPSQLHDIILPAHSKYEWTQCFGGMEIDNALAFSEDYSTAVDHLNIGIKDRLSFDDITTLDERCTRLADIPVTEDKIRHMGSGFGALEIMRMEQDGDGIAPENLCFPSSTLGDEERVWLYLLKNGEFPPDPPDKLPLSYMVSDKWIDRIRSATEKNDSYLAFLHLGVATYENQRIDVLLTEAYDENREEELTRLAKAACKASVGISPSVLAYRNLAVIESTEGNKIEAEKYYDLAMALPEACDDFALASEYMIFLNAQQKYEKCWEIFDTLPDLLKKQDRIRISAALAAVKLDRIDYLDLFFTEEHSDIREGENSLTDIWFEYCARKLARERGIDSSNVEAMDKLIDEAWKTCPPAYSIDFRMSYNRHTKYRI
ncbi:MAG: DUF5107 domain-containing protein [Clostridia bacterium]|nr:DUF5107 domain-containing protein [Clostridia bacterium]